MMRNERGYDVIGDVHGCLKELRSLLEKLGYRRGGNNWYHPRRSVIFVGDLIDRGPDILGVLDTVAEMVRAGNAKCLLGNHERDFVFYHLAKNGEFIRPRDEIREKQLEATNSQLKSGPEIEFWVQWCRHLPVVFEQDGLRVVHASWNADAVRFWRDKLLSDEAVMDQLVDPQSVASKTLGRLVFGPVFFVENEDEYVGVRARWYCRPDDLPELTTWHASYHRFDWTPSRPVTAEEALLLEGYDDSEPPLIYGHQSLPLGSPMELVRHNIACVDYSAVYGGALCAYRWSGERRLEKGRLVAVRAISASH